MADGLRADPGGVEELFAPATATLQIRTTFQTLGFQKLRGGFFTTTDLDSSEFQKQIVNVTDEDCSGGLGFGIRVLHPGLLQIVPSSIGTPLSAKKSRSWFRVWGLGFGA